MAVDIDVLIIGAGMSGIGVGIQLIRQFSTRSFELIEKSDNIGGTWWLNSYPGCGCDVPSHFYSYSFDLNPEWSQVYASQPEIHRYFESVAEKYDIPRHVSFHSSVLSAQWDDIEAIWEVTVYNHKTTNKHVRRCKVLVSAVGALSIPKKCDIEGAESFEGRLFHSAEWDHSFDWSGKKVVAIGNGCSATQFVPIMSQGPNAVKKITQFSRQAHWLSERPNPAYSSLFKSALRWIPGLMRLYRAKLYWDAEKTFSGFDTITGAREREQWTKTATSYIQKAAPAKYRDVLIPKTVIGCKRRVNDTGYLECLHRNNVELIPNDPIFRIVETGIETKSGRFVPADAIVLATGFETQKALYPLDIRGENGISLTEYWDHMSEGSASAYFGTCLAKFPNFFMMMGPNVLSGHLSVIYTVECQINFTMRVIAPILQSPRSLLSPLSSEPAYEKVIVTEEAARRDDEWLQNKAKKIVWATGCSSWFINPKTGRNTQLYPDWQYKFWLRSFCIPKSDFVYTRQRQMSLADERGTWMTRPRIWGTFTLFAAALSWLSMSQRHSLEHWTHHLGSLADPLYKLSKQ